LGIYLQKGSNPTHTDISPITFKCLNISGQTNLYFI